MRGRKTVKLEYHFGEWDIVLTVKYPRKFGPPVVPDISAIEGTPTTLSDILSSSSQTTHEALLHWPRRYEYISIVNGLPVTTVGSVKGLTIKISMTARQ